MNPKGVTDLDPKLKEAYDRIMGSSNTKPANEPPLTVAPPAGQTTPQDSTANQNPPQLPQPPVMQTQTVDVKPSASETLSQFQPIQQANPAALTAYSEPPVNNFAQTESPSTSPQNKKLSIPMPVVLFVAIVFLGVYSLVWAKVFGLF